MKERTGNSEREPWKLRTMIKNGKNKETSGPEKSVSSQMKLERTRGISTKRGQPRSEISIALVEGPLGKPKGRATLVVLLAIRNLIIVRQIPGRGGPIVVDWQRVLRQGIQFFSSSVEIQSRGANKY